MPHTILALDFLHETSPSQLLCWLSKHLDSYPIWLNNDGQNVIGILPKWAISTHFDSSQNQYITTNTQRKTIDFYQVAYQNALIEEDFFHFQQRLTNYYNQQCSENFSEDRSYQNGLMGFISYDCSAHQLAKPTKPSYLSDNQPLAYFGHYDVYLTFTQARWQLHLTSEQAITKADKILSFLAELIKDEPANLALVASLSLTPLWQPSAYQAAFDQVQAYLKAGDCYQINLTQCWEGQLTDRQLVDYLPKLHQATQAPFAGYVGLNGYELLSCSPELFFTFAVNPVGEHTLITKPIKGTIPRGKTASEDIANKTALAHSEKDTAENVMIVDLLRNDLGKYAKIGSVNVPTLFAIESFSNVHHMVSTITATLKAGVSPWTVLFDSLPAGSITGTPKKRAVEIIHELEAKPRGAYCGTLGYLNFDGTGQWNVLIRTLQASHHQVSLWAGGGITIASECEAEYQECFDKVGNLLGLLQHND